MNGPRILVKVPASTANLGPGFDALGMALSLFAWIEMQAASETSITMFGDGMEDIPTDKTNLIYKVAQLVFEEAGVAVPELSITMYSDIPLTRGLGSSASAIVGALVAANALVGSPLTNDRLFQIATKLEGHPDNVGASLFGGIVVSAWDGERADHVRIEPHTSLETLVAVPSFQLSTEKARHALPKTLNMSDAVFNVGRSSLLVAALSAGRLDLISTAMRDRLHQPYRAPLIPGMSTILEHAAEHGALGAALSGAGPTIITFVDGISDRKKELEQFLKDTFAAEGIEAETIWLQPCKQGTQWRQISESDETPLMDRIRNEVRAK
ncbi:homoserine kinase [Paenibacillus cellulosilyticus]|uniref:Homoserine kinase n=1 Tax=Paenibacillus cellulosilyticus TaxID=375489 RepID=A0A2V2YGG6_9BACL|nr:homoserine kinase [Paenibacillus cellulosilyticus]PWV91973.1 homoserine kinase [Paenibacillus cellulosilyticus]QKS46669.1 homoserine kinase [Paenibacillus cellulosilyticus]